MKINIRICIHNKPLFTVIKVLNWLYKTSYYLAKVFCYKNKLYPLFTFTVRLSFLYGVAYGRIKHCLIQISCCELLLDRKTFALIHWI